MLLFLLWIRLSVCLSGCANTTVSECYTRFIGQNLAILQLCSEVIKTTDYILCKPSRPNLSSLSFELVNEWTTILLDTLVHDGTAHVRKAVPIRQPLPLSLPSPTTHIFQEERNAIVYIIAFIGILTTYIIPTNNYKYSLFCCF